MKILIIQTAFIGDAILATALAEKLLKDGEVAVVPGSAFGAPGYIRLSFACSIDTLKESVVRIRRVLG